MPVLQKVVGGTNYADKYVVWGFPPTATGYVDKTSSVLTYTTATRQMTIAPTGTSYPVYLNGKLVYITSSKSITVPQNDAFEGIHNVFMDINGNLQVVYTSAYPDYSLLGLVGDGIYIGAIYWDSTNLRINYFGDGRQAVGIDKATLEVFNINALKWFKGCTPGNFTLGNGSANADAQFSISAGYFMDNRDKFTSLAVGTTESITMSYLFGSPSQPVLRQGTPISGFKVLNTGVDGRLAYNTINGGIWTLVPVTNNYYVNFHYMALNDFNSSRRIIGICGIAEYLSISDAREGIKYELPSLSRIYRFDQQTELYSQIYQTSNTYTNAVKAKIVQSNTYINAPYPCIDHRSRR